LQQAVAVGATSPNFAAAWIVRPLQIVATVGA
jgi:hypothetical protein